MGGLEKTYICMSSLELDIGQLTIIYLDTKCLSTVQFLNLQKEKKIKTIKRIIRGKEVKIP